eukprot:scaffold2539_cov166-Isochrysis_galbana.AAC.1
MSSVYACTQHAVRSYGPKGQHLYGYGYATAHAPNSVPMGPIEGEHSRSTFSSGVRFARGAR